MLVFFSLLVIIVTELKGRIAQVGLDFGSVAAAEQFAESRRKSRRKGKSIRLGKKHFTHETRIAISTVYELVCCAICCQSERNVKSEKKVT